VAALGFRSGLTPIALVSVRGAVGGILLLVVAALLKTLRGLPRPAVLGALVVGGLLFGGQLLCYYAAIRVAGAQMSLVVVHVYPILVVGMVALRERRAVRPAVGVVAALMLVGIVLVAGVRATDLSLTGLGFALASATLYALYIVCGGAWVTQVPPVAAGALVTVGSTLFTGVAALMGGLSLNVESGEWWVVLVQGLVLIPVGIGGAFIALRHLGAVAASLLGMLEPVVGLLVAMLVLGERLLPLQWAGAALVIACCAVLPVLPRASGRA